MGSKRFQAIALLLVATAILAIRLAGPPNLMDKDQERPASYVLDAVLNGNWIVQHDWMGGVSSKPPLYTWLAALATLPSGRISYFSLYLPAALSVLFTALLILRRGGGRFGPSAAFPAAITFLVSPIMFRQVALARTDALFMLMVTLAALAAFDAWKNGRSWAWFWVLAALATLTKGPLGLLLAAGGLLAGLWGRRENDATRPMWREHAAGLAVYLLFTGGWLVLAYHEAGQEFVTRVLKRELVGHMVSGDKGEAPLRYFYEPTLYFLGRFAPWSLVACVGFWRVLRRPAADPDERLFERFLFCWFFLGLLVFSLAPHQRPDLLSPVIPPAALLGGRELQRWLSRIAPVRQLALAAAVVAIVLGGAAGYYLRRHDVWIERTLGMEKLAREIREKVGDAPLVHVESPYTLQFYLNTMSTMVSPEEAARRLAGSNRVYATVCNFRLVREHLPEGVDVNEVARWPDEGKAFVSVISNQ
jgi:4-amino-4-deoxy-L-arabinose transferase-like glycosyltransferase